MRQFVLPSPPDPSGRLEIRGGDSHYLRNVLRMAAGSRFPALDRSGGRYTCTLEQAGPEYCVLSVRADNTAAPVPEPRLVLLQCIAKGKRMDLVIRQATEAGVSSIVPLFSARSVPRYTETDAAQKRERWERIAREAVQQCGRTVLPEISNPLPFADIPVATGMSTVGICLHERPLDNGTLHGYLSDIPDVVMMVIGPEGGLTEDELAFVSDRGYRFINLGPTVLRTETAALYATAAVRTILLERDSWKKPF